jgi:hypothetical protein
MRRDRVPDRDGVSVHQDVLDKEADDLLPIRDLQRLRRLVQPPKEVGQGFGEAQKRHPVSGLVEDGLQFRQHGLFASAQLRHPATQLVEGQEVLLIGREQALHALPGPRQLAFQSVLPPLRRFGGAGRVEAPVELGLDERRVLDQVDDLPPHDPVEQVLADRSAVAHRAAEMAPRVRAEAAIIMDLARGAARRRPRQRVAAFAARDQSLDDAGLDGPARREALVVG